ncbi:hypothetical protein [Glutamicibacter nicotianae]|uniref:hypothetical protein n=1 Tax=Glutamicibacter nicotianae TaxID=37929 RepID=UPI00167F54A8|nr:hypothetical protein [Glutamicibacter nicotianae]
MPDQLVGVRINDEITERCLPVGSICVTPALNKPFSKDLEVSVNRSVTSNVQSGDRRISTYVGDAVQRVGQSR